MDIWSIIADRKILEAMEEGAFNNLRGTGHPLNLEDDASVDPSQRMAYRLLRNSGFAPDWIEEAKEIDAEIARLGAAGSDMDAADRRKRVELLNRRIAVYNLKAPSEARLRRVLKTDGSYFPT